MYSNLLNNFSVNGKIREYKYIHILHTNVSLEDM